MTKEYETMTHNQLKQQALSGSEAALDILLERRKMTSVEKPKDIINIVQYLAYQQQEHFVVILLNGAHQIMSLQETNIGTLNRMLIHPREVYRDAIIQNAAAIIVVHNHPSDNCEPSAADIELTKGLVDAGKIVGIRLLDSIIVTKKDYFSFGENDLI